VVRSAVLLPMFSNLATRMYFTYKLEVVLQWYVYTLYLSVVDYDSILFFLTTIHAILLFLPIYIVCIYRVVIVYT
jgi:hypothetical protein